MSFEKLNNLILISQLFIYFCKLSKKKKKNILNIVGSLKNILSL